MLAKRGHERCLEKWGPTAEYLTDQIPEHSFVIVPLGFDEVCPAVEQTEVDFVLINPCLYVTLERSYDVSPLATLNNQPLDTSYTVYGGVVFCRADRQDIQSLADLKGKTFMGVDEWALGGWLAAWREFKERRIDPFHDFAALRFGGTHDAVVHAVRDGQVDAGTVRTHTLERVAQEGKIRLDDFRVLPHDRADGETHRYHVLPFPHSTDAYPEDPFARLEHVPDELVRQVAVALLRMPGDSPAANAAHCEGWVVPHTYQPVHDCLKELRVGPYKDFGRITLGDVLRRYWPWIVSVVVLLACMSVTLAWVLRLLGQRKQAEEVIASAHAELDQIFNSVADAMRVTDRDFNVLRVNDTFLALSGSDRAEATGRKCYEVFSSSLCHTSDCPLTRILGGEKGVSCEIEKRARNGLRIPCIVTATPFYGAGGELVGIVEDAKDITDRNRAEQTIREERDRAQSYLDVAGTMIAIVDPSERISLINQKGCEILGYQREELLGQNWFNLLVPQRIRAEVRGVFQKLMASDIAPVKYYENPLLTRDGEERLIAFHNTVLTEPSGRITAVLLSAEDITVRKRAEEQLRIAKEMAEAADRAKSEFLANMSHEIRTPMTAILGFADLLLERGNLDDAPPERIEAAETIKRNGEHLLDVINDILDISKIEAGRMTVELTPCSPCQIIAQVASLMKVKVAGKGLAFNVEYIGTVPETIRTDPTRLRQILINLVGNAIKFTDVGGVRLVTRFVDDACGPLVQFDIVDTGLGMTKEQAAKLFDPFTQADTSTTRKFGGTGLGLTISKRLAQMLGGDVAVVETQEGIGTRFRVTVPTGPFDGVKMVDEPPFATALDTEGAEGFSPRGTAQAEACGSSKLDCRILLAEDAPDSQRLISYVLSKAGAEVTAVENGKLAVEAALVAREEGKPFDVILMDMQMPVMNGYEATRLLRRKGYTDPIIALTAHAMEWDREKCLDAGCDDYATKPIDRKKLVAMIRSNLLSVVATG